MVDGQSTHKLMQLLDLESHVVLQHEVMRWLGCAFQTRVRLQEEVREVRRGDDLTDERSGLAVCL